MALVTWQSFSDAKGTWVEPALTCARDAPVHSVWYELVPAPQVQTSLQVSPGDTVTAEVSVAGTQVTLSITDTTTGGTFSTTTTLPAPDTTLAEWIAEAPSQCLGASATRSRPLPLAPFGTVSFTAASATANGHTGVISDTAWTPGDITLRGLLGGTSAAPSTLGADGASFTVTTRATPAPVVLPTRPSRGWWGWWPPRRARGR